MGTPIGMSPQKLQCNCYLFTPLVSLGHLMTSGEARGHACHVLHDQSLSVTKSLFQTSHKTKSYVLHYL